MPIWLIQMLNGQIRWIVLEQSFLDCECFRLKWTTIRSKLVKNCIRHSKSSSLIDFVSLEQNFRHSRLRLENKRKLEIFRLCWNQWNSISIYQWSFCGWISRQCFRLVRLIWVSICPLIFLKRIWKVYSNLRYILNKNKSFYNHYQINNI